jgi:hypothetical protein
LEGIMITGITLTVLMYLGLAAFGYWLSKQEG